MISAKLGHTVEATPFVLYHWEWWVSECWATGAVGWPRELQDQEERTVRPC